MINTMLFYNLFYFTVPLIAIVCSFFRDNRKLFLVLIGSLMILILTFRGINVGSDTITYYNIFNWSGNANLTDLTQSSVEICYLFLNKFVHLIGGNFTLLLFVIAVITIFGILYFIYTVSSNVVMSIIVFIGFTYYFMSFNISRQFLAIGIDLAASAFLIKGKRWQSLILIIIAGLMHNSGYLYLILWLLINSAKITKKKFVLFTGITAVLSIPISKLIGNYMANNERYGIYTNNTVENKGLFGILFAIVLLLLLIMMVVNFDFENNKLVDRYILVAFTFIVLIDLLSIFYPFLGRIRYSFEVLLIVIVPYLVVEYKFERFNLITNTALFLVGIVIMNSLIPNNIFYGIVPYFG